MVYNICYLDTLDIYIYASFVVLCRVEHMFLIRHDTSHRLHVQSAKSNEWYLSTAQHKCNNTVTPTNTEIMLQIRFVGSRRFACMRMCWTTLSGMMYAYGHVCEFDLFYVRVMLVLCKVISVLLPPFQMHQKHHHAGVWLCVFFSHAQNRHYRQLRTSGFAVGKNYWVLLTVELKLGVNKSNIIFFSTVQLLFFVSQCERWLNETQSRDA